MSMGPARCQRHDGPPGLHSSALCTCPPPPARPAFRVPEHLAEQPPSPIQQWLEQQLDVLAEVHTALEDMAMVRALAAHPWALHWLAATEPWAAYADAVRAR